VRIEWFGSRVVVDRRRVAAQRGHEGPGAPPRPRTGGVGEALSYPIL
jgi:hypothetical protein